VNLTRIRLTIDGWKAYIDLRKGKTEGKQAFMAMKFGDPMMDRIYLDHFKRAATDTGFELKRLDEGQAAGLIDDRLRVEIRKSKFLIADLTDHNNGAYWEAGYAEGLGKPVIYTCRKDVFEDKENTTHFDTNHHLTVVWEHDKLDDAVKQLKATIRATLPENAKMEDSLMG
jgi:nucleoside 2-deoxyribosyltransferase